MKIVDLHDILRFLRKSGVYLIHPPPSDVQAYRSVWELEVPPAQCAALSPPPKVGRAHLDGRGERMDNFAGVRNSLCKVGCRRR